MGKIFGFVALASLVWLAPVNAKTVVSLYGPLKCVGTPMPQSDSRKGIAFDLQASEGSITIKESLMGGVTTISRPLTLVSIEGDVQAADNRLISIRLKSHRHPENGREYVSDAQRALTHPRMQSAFSGILSLLAERSHYNVICVGTLMLL